MTIFIKEGDKKIYPLSEEFQNKGGNTESKCQYNDRYISNDRYSIKQFIRDEYDNNRNNKRKESKGKYSQWKGDNSQNGSEYKIYYCEDHPKNNSTRIAILQFDSRNISWFCN